MIHENVLPTLENLAKNTTLKNAYIFHSDAEESAINSAYYVIEKKLGTKKPNENLIILEREKTIKTEDIRYLLEEIKYGSVNEKPLIIYIQNIDTLTPQAGNAFLKTLEEPPKGVCFLMTTQKLKHVLKTILSRSQLLFVPSRIEDKNTEFKELNALLSLSIHEQIKEIEALSADKKDIENTLYHWLKVSLSENKINTKKIDILMDSIERLKYNVNGRLQLESCILKINT